MWDACRLLWSLLIGLFRSRASLEAENLALRQQIVVLRRHAPKRFCFNIFDRLVAVGLYRLFPDVRDALAVVRPETIIRWHRAGFRAYWRWRSRPRRGRPTVPFEIRQLIRDMSLANPLWGECHMDPCDNHNRNAWEHGHYSAQSIALRRLIRRLLSERGGARRAVLARIRSRASIRLGARAREVGQKLAPQGVGIIHPIRQRWGSYLNESLSLAR